ncbi:hypothetical protein HGRIS_006014 [Hohenbuehelia grisea]|uniref:Uncharacterized protein n=1 Tax=Hohenbuehelia grisea TaxID=104357 RepID=A0ABR3K104_9AGAR
MAQFSDRQSPGGGLSPGGFVAPPGAGYPSSYPSAMPPAMASAPSIQTSYYQYSE